MLEPSEFKRRQNLKLMQDPSDWAQWPYLPLINRSSSGVGLLQADLGGKVPPVVYLKNLWSEVPLSQVEKLEYASLEAILDDGWEVD